MAAKTRDQRKDELIEIWDGPDGHERIVELWMKTVSPPTDMQMPPPSTLVSQLVLQILEKEFPHS
jgi:hypothetical protein